MTTTSKVTDYLGVGLLAARPISLSLAPGGLGFYYATDTSQLFVWTGASWAIVATSAVISSVGQTALGTNQATGFGLIAQYTAFSSVAAGTGATLPTVAGGQIYNVYNRGANGLLVYPQFSAQIEAYGVNNPVTVPVGGNALFFAQTSSLWYTA